MKAINIIKTIGATLFHTKSFFVGFLLCWLFPNYAWAYDAYVGGIYYNLNTTDRTAEVTYKNGSHYRYSMYIPASIDYEGITYSVTSIGREAFFADEMLTHVDIPNSVTDIGNAAFIGCKMLTHITIPNSVIRIGGGAFEQSGLVSMEIPNSVIEIGGGAFEDCTSLTSVTIGNSVDTIGAYAFLDCTSLTSIIIDENNEVYDSRNNCNAIIETATNTLIYGCNNTIIPNSVTGIGDYAFYGCTGLTSVEIPNSVTGIGDYAFYGCTGLTSVEIPNSVTGIGEYAFSECTGLTSITVEWTTPLAINESVFEGVDKSNCTLYIPQGTKTAYENAQYWNEFENIVFNVGLDYGTCGDHLTYTIYSNMTMVIVGTGPMYYDPGFQRHIDNNIIKTIEKVIIEEGVTSIGYNAFYGFAGLTSVTIPNSLTRIRDFAFYGCTGLTSVTISNSVTSIGEYAFYECTGLTSVRIPNSVASIGQGAFSRCGGLTSIYVDTNNAIYDSRENCNAIIETSTNTLIAGCKNTVIPNSVTSIGVYAFNYCTGLTSIVIPNSVTSIGDHAFTSCTDLTSLEISNSVSSIGVSAFENCTGLTSLDIPNSVTSIGNQAFMSCTGLTSLVIPNSVTSIGDQSFYNCTGLTSLDIPNSVVSVGEFAFCENRLKTLTIGSGLTRIGDLAFNPSWEDWRYDPDRGLVSIYVDPNNTTYDSRENCNAIIESSSNKLIVGSRNTVIPNSVTTIGWGAFGHTSGLTSVTIPSSVTSIEDDAFAICKDLASIYVECEIPPFIDSWSGINPFHDVDLTNCILYVPKGCISVYESAPFWSDFENIQEKDPDTKISDYDNIVYIEGVEAVSSQQVRLSLKMNNTIEATGFQCDVYLPDGVTAAQDEEGFYLMDISEERTTSRKTDYSSSALLPDGGLRFMCSSTRSYTFSGNEGEVAYLIVDIDPDMEGGSYPLILKNVEISDANSNAYRVSYVKTTLNIHTLGDANNDGSIGVSDFTAIANYIMGMPPASFIEIAADVNADDVISVSDLTGVANIILYGTVSPNSSNAKTRYDVADKYANVGANDVVATTDKEFSVAVNINGNFAYSGYQFDMTLPEGMSVKNVEGQTKASDVFMSGMIDDNTLRVLCASTMGETTESTVVNLTLVADVEGTYRIDIDNAIASADAYSCTMSTSSFLVAIDNNATGISTINDELGSNAAVYDLTGKMMNSKIDISSLPKGIYLINGKKVSKE